MTDMDTVDKSEAWDAATAIPPKTYAVLLGCAASLAAAISLLERGGKKAAPSDKMFEQMLCDYRASLEKARELLKREHIRRSER